MAIMVEGAPEAPKDVEVPLDPDAMGVYPSILILGPAKSGKTVTACTASKYWGDKDQPWLLDTVLVDYDDEGDAGLSQFGKAIPEDSVIRVAQSMYTLGYDDVLKWEQAVMFPKLHELYRLGKRVFIFDPMSTRWDMVNRALTREEAESAAQTRSGKANEYKFWPKARGTSADYVVSATQFPYSIVVFTCHTHFKALQQDQQGDNSATSERKHLTREALDPTGYKIGLMMPGQTGEPFVNRTSMVLAQRLRLDPRNGFERFLLTRDTSQEFRCFSRYEQWHDAEEPPYIRPLVNKIRARKAETLNIKRIENNG
jgi:hypothetical protein